MKEHKLFIQRIGIVGVANIAVIFSSIIIIPIITKTITPAEFGTWVQFIGTIGLMPFLTTLGLPFAMIRFLASTKDVSKIQEVFYSFFFIMLIFTLFVSSIIAVYSPQISAALFGGNKEVIIFLPICIFLASIISFLHNYFRTFQQIRIYSIFLISQTYLNVIFVTYFIFSNYGLFGAFLGYLISQILVLILMGLIVLHQISFHLPKFDKIYCYLKFSIPTIPSNISQWVVNAGDRYIIAIFLGTSFVGFYSLGYTLANLLIIFFAPFSFILPSILSQKYDSKKFDDIKLILSYSFKSFLAIAIPTAVGISFLSKELITILSTPEMASQAFIVTPFIAIGMLFWGIYAIMENILIIEKKTKIIGVIWIFAAILNTILNLVLVPYIGIIGAGISTLITFMISSLYSIVYSFKFIKFDFDLTFIAKSILSSISMALVLVLLVSYNFFLIVNISLSAIAYLISMFILKSFTNKEINLIKKTIFGRILRI